MNDRHFNRRRLSETPMLQEARALEAAMPLRPVSYLVDNDRFYILECGHWMPIEAPLENGSEVRCLQCYKEQIAQAGQMIDGPDGLEGIR